MTKRKRGRGRGAGRSPSTPRTPAVAKVQAEDPEDSPTCKKTFTPKDEIPEVNLRKRSGQDISVSEKVPILKRTSRRFTERISLVETSDEKGLSSENESNLSEEPTTEVINKGNIVVKRVKLIRNTDKIVEKEEIQQINLKTPTKTKYVEIDKGLSRSSGDDEVISEVMDVDKVSSNIIATIGKDNKNSTKTTQSIEKNISSHDEICSLTEQESNLTEEEPSGEVRNLDICSSGRSPNLKRSSRRITERISLVETSVEKDLPSEKETNLSEESSTELINNRSIVGKRLKLIRNTDKITGKEDTLQINLKTISKTKNVDIDKELSRSLDKEAISEVMEINKAPFAEIIDSTGNDSQNSTNDTQPAVNLITSYDEICSSTEKESNLSDEPGTEVINNENIAEKSMNLIQNTDIIMESKDILKNNLKTPVKIKKIEGPLKSSDSEEVIGKAMEVDQVHLTHIDNAVCNNYQNISTNATQSTDSLTTSSVEEVSSTGIKDEVEVIYIDLASEKNLKSNLSVSYSKAMKNVFEEDEVEDELIYEDLNDQGEKDNPINIDEDEDEEIDLKTIQNMESILRGVIDDDASNMSPKTKIVIKIPQGTAPNKPKTHIGLGEELKTKEKTKMESSVPVIAKLKTTGENKSNIKNAVGYESKPDEPKMYSGDKSKIKFGEDAKIETGDRPKPKVNTITKHLKITMEDEPEPNRKKIKVSDSAKIVVDEDINMSICDEPINLDIEFNDLDLEKEFWTETSLQIENEGDMKIKKTPLVTPNKGPVVTSKKTPVVTPNKGPVVASKKTPVFAPKKTPVFAPKKTPVVSPKKTPVVPQIKTPVDSQKNTTVAAIKDTTIGASKSKSIITQKELVIAPKKGPIVAPKKEPIVAPKKEPIAAPKKEPIAAPKKELIAAPKKETIVAPKKEPIVAPKKEPIVAPKKEPIVAPNKEAVVDPKKVSDSSQTPKTTSSKPGATNILGLSFIIGIKGEDVTGKPKFDCVLCNPHSSTFNGPAMHTHVKTRKHIINAMEVQSFALFEKYKNDQQITTDKLLQILTEYEKSQKKQHLAVATTETYLNVRKRVEETIVIIKNTLKSNATEKNVEAEAKRFKEIIEQGSINVTRKYQAELKELAKLQSKRTPKNVLLVLDERNKSFKNAFISEIKRSYKPNALDNFEALFIPSINLYTAYSVLKNDSSFNTGTAYVFIAGTFSFIQKDDLLDCAKNKCPNPGKYLKISKNDPIDQAIELHKKILKNTENDILIFTGLLPVQIIAYSAAIVKRRLCKHDVNFPRCKLAISAYKFMLSNFNTFVEEHSRALGFSTWDYHKEYIQNQTTLKARKIQFFESDGFTFSQKYFNFRKLDTKRFVKELILCLTASKRKLDRSKSKSVEKSADASCEDSRNKLRDKPKPLMSIDMDMKKTNNKDLKFEKVVIMANNLYEPILRDLANENVIIMAEEDLSCNELKNYVMKKRDSISSNTLWLSTTGIFGIANQETTKLCMSNKQNCYHPLQSLIPCEDMKSLPNAKKIIGTLTDVMTTTIRDIKLAMSQNSYFMIIPPIPVSIVDESSFTHSELHSFIQKHPNFFIASLADMHHLNLLFELLSKEIRNSALRECKLTYKSAYTCLNADISIDKVSSSNIPKKCSFQIWKEMILNLISDVLITDSEKVKVKRVDDDLDFHSSRVVIFDEEKFDNKRKIYTKNKEYSEKSKFDQIVFIGSESIVKQAISHSKHSHSSNPPWSFFEIKNPVNWTEFLKQCNDWKSATKKFLFVFVPDLSMVAKDVNDTQCSRFKCKEYLSHSSLSLVGSRVSEFQSLVNGITDVCSSKSKLILLPICPRACIQKTTLEDKPTHLLLHQVITHKSNPLLLEGPQNKWIDASDAIERAWKVTSNKIQEHSHSAIDVSSLIEDQKKIRPIEWKLPNASSLDCASNSEKQWLECFEATICASLKEQNIEKKQNRGNSPIFIKEITRPKVVASDVRNDNRLLSNYENTSIYSPASSFQPHLHSEQIPFVSLPNNQFLQPSNQFVQPSNSSQQIPPQYVAYNQTPHNVECLPNPVNSQLNPAVGNYSRYQGMPIISNNNYPMQATIEQPTPLQDLMTIPHISQASTEFPSAKHYQDKNLSRSYEEFISSLANVCDSFKQPPIFERVVFIGKRELVEPLSTIKVESTAIYHNLANVEESDTQSILLKLGTIRPRTLCCLIFGLSVITKAQSISSSCSNFNCKQSLPIMILKSFKKKGREFFNMPSQEIISNRLQSIIAFVKRLRAYLPVIVLPLYPSRIFCDDGTSVASHNICHALNGQDNYVVYGTGDVWEQHYLSVTQIWNKIMDVNHKEFQSSALIKKYIEEQPRIFLIKDKVNDFFTHWAEPTVWKTFSETVVQSLVLLMPGSSSITQNIKEKIQDPVENKMIKEKKSRFSINVKNPNAPAAIKIWKLSDSIPETFFTDLFKAIDSSSQIKKNKDNYIVEFGKRNGAELLASKLNECQLCDTTLRAEIIGEEGDEIVLNKIQETYINSIFNQIYAKWKFLMSQTMKRKLSLVMDVATFKTSKCLGNCEGADRCVYYHNSGDKRRNPLQFKYSQKMCQRPRNSLGNCSLGDSCSMSHNTYEQMFFPSNFQTISCPSNTPQRQCFKKPLCKFAHIDTPEMFFNLQWEDLVVFGTENTMNFFCGAIRGLSKVNLTKCDFKVLLISPSLEFLDLVAQAISGFTHLHRVKVVTLTSKWIDLESYQVILGTPSALASSQNQIFNAKTGGAFIVDDVKKILANNSDKDAVLKFIHKIKLATSFENNVNKVFVSSIYDDKITEVLSRTVGLKLKEVKETEVVEDTKLKVLDDSSGPPSLHRDYNKSKSPVARPFSPPKRTRSPSRDRNRNHGRSKERDSKNNSRSHSQSRNKRSRTRSPKSSKNNKKFQMDKYSSESDSTRESHHNNGFSVSSMSSVEPKKSLLPTPHHNRDDKQASSWDDELRNKLGQQLYDEYLKEESEAKEKFEEEYKVFKDVSELHPDYEIYFEDFISKYNLKHQYKGEKHKETLWHQFWSVKFPEIKQTEWDQQKKELVKSYEAKSLNLRSAQSSNTSVGSAVGVNPDVFSVENTLNLLEGLCSKLGMLGPALKAMILSSRKLGINTKEGLDVFIDSENVLLVNMVLDKLKNVMLESPRNMIGTFERAIDWTGRLLEAAKKGPPMASRPLDLNAIAKASFGKDMSFVVQLIKAALAYEGTLQPGKDLINELYLKVCSLHFNMAMN